MRELGALVQSSKQGTGRCCLLLGDAGIGKSRVLSELAQFAVLQGFVTQRIQCRSSHRNRPLAAFIELAPALRSLPGAIGCSPETLTLLDRLTRYQPTRGNRQTEKGDPAWIFSGVRRALFDLVDAVAHEGPILIHVEDTQWLDPESTDLLREMMPWAAGRKVLFALTGRELPDSWQSNLPHELRVIRLGPLAPNDSAELVLDIVHRHAAQMSADYVKWCTRAAEGNPYFLSELANHWIETRAEHQVPPSLSTVLNQRVSRLDADSIQLLQAVALLENNSTLKRIEAVLEYDAHSLLRCINTLGSADMLVAEADSAQTAVGDLIASKHELLSNAALTLLSVPAKRFLHRRIGQALEQDIDEHVSTATLWDCAKHWMLAGDGRHAWHLATSCASHLMKVGLMNAAADAYARCLSFCTNDEQRLDILTSQTYAFYGTSDWAKVRESAAAVRTLRMRVDPSASVHDDVELMDLRAEWQSLKWDHVVAKAVGCLQCVEASPGHRAEAGVMALMLLGFVGDRSSMLKSFETIETLSSTGEVREDVVLQSRMVYYTNCGNLDNAVLAARALISEQRLHEHVGELFRAQCNAAVTFRVAGLFDDAEGSFIEALRIAESHGLQAAQERALPLLANLALETGKIDDARRWFSQIESLPLDPSNRYSLLERRGIATRLALHDGDALHAQTTLPMSYADASADPVFHRRTYNLALHAAVGLALDGSVKADRLAALRESFDASKGGPHQSFASSVLFLCLRRAGDPDEATAMLNDYSLKFRREPWPIPSHLLDTLERALPIQPSAAKSKRSGGVRSRPEPA
jgi:tetratricopeptide (TPR) repeat protein